MRLTQKVCAQHLGWMFKKHWKVQGKRATGELGPTVDLSKEGIVVKDSSAVAANKVINYLPCTIVNTLAKNTSNSKNINYVLEDSNILYQGLDQALFLTKTIKIDGLPKQLEKAIENTQLPNTNHTKVKEAILESFYFDAEQEKTRVIKSADRPAFVFPRKYGITDIRRSQMIISKLISECENIAGKLITVNRKIVNNDNSIVSFEKDSNIIQLNITAETVISSKRPLEAVKDNYEGCVPDLYPMNCTISIPRKPVSPNRSSFLHREDCVYSNPHTIFSHCSSSELINNHGTPMTNSQFHARNMLRAFGIATSKAHQMYGAMITQIPKPIVVQSIQTDGKTFHFGIFQLNTLELNETNGINNYWFNTPTINLFDFCEKRPEKPDLDSYNKMVLTKMSVFYNNF